LTLNSEFFAVKDTFFVPRPSINCRGFLLDFSTPRVMVILNATPDSYYTRGRSSAAIELSELADQMLKDGADLLDIGGYSSRPGAEDISEQKEINRVVPVIESVLEKHPDAIISVDTFRARVAEKALNAGAAIINDISGGTIDSELTDVVIENNVPYVLMHMRGTPQTMAQHTNYDDVLQEVIITLSEKINRLREKGVADIIVDPGFGFAKKRSQSFHLLNKLEVFKVLDCPVLAGVSRKSMISKTLGITAEESLNGSTVLHTISLQKGANILRVHDVKEAVQAVRLWEKVNAKFPA